MNVLFLTVFFQRDGSHAGNLYKREGRMALELVVQRCFLVAYCSHLVPRSLFTTNCVQIVMISYFQACCMSLVHLTKRVQKFKWSETKFVLCLAWKVQRKGSGTSRNNKLSCSASTQLSYGRVVITGGYIQNANKSPFMKFWDSGVLITYKNLK